MPSDVFAPYRAPLEAALKAALPRDDSPVSAACRYVMGWEDDEGRPSVAGGKRLRPLVTCHVANLFGAPFETVLPGAVAIELVHNFSLVHDEIQDQDATRHGRPTLWARFGTAQAINAGDLLFSRAFSVLGDISAPAIGARYTAILTAATEEMIRGQWKDLEFEGRDDVAADEYLDMVAGKTGALIGACAAFAGVAAERDEDTVESLRQWGVSIGLAFQAQDDYLGIWGDSAQTGKSNTNDIARRKKSLPVLLGLAAAPRDVILLAFGQPEPGATDIAKVVHSLEAAGIRDQAASMSARFRAEAEALLDALPDADARSGLLTMGKLLVDRES